MMKLSPEHVNEFKPSEKLSKLPEASL